MENYIEKERLTAALDALIQNKVVRNRAEFIESLGCSSSSYLSKIESGEKPFTKKFAQTISKTYPFLTAYLTESAEDLPAMNPNYGAALVNRSEARSPFAVRVLPIEAQAGSLQEYAQSVSDNDCEWSASPIKNADFIVPVAGDSMYPEYPNGSRVVVKKIDEKAFIEWGKVYLLDTVNGAIIKQVHECADPDYIKCVSINPHYASFAVRREDIYGMYRVVMLLTLK